MSCREMKINVNPDGLNFTDGYSALCTAVILRAIEDWRGLIEWKAWKDTYGYEYGRNVQFEELRNFFRSEWCAAIIPPEAHITPEEILRKLEQELQEAIEKDRAGR